MDQAFVVSDEIILMLSCYFVIYISYEIKSKVQFESGILNFFLVPWESPHVPKPTPPQLKYQKDEIMALIHFNMATFAKDGDPGCDASNWNKKESYAAGPTYVQ